jgi:lipopolysaccharide cholinephosphotransferase
MYEYLAQLDNNKNSHYICPYKNAFAYMHKYKKEMVAEYMMIPFEDITLMSMKGYHECLTTAYGDYMKPPPKEERKPMHGNATI